MVRFAMPGSRVFLALCSALLAALLACGDENSPSPQGPPPPPADAMPDFCLVDVNPNTASSGRVVSPRDYLQKVSAWYFGYAT